MDKLIGSPRTHSGGRAQKYFLDDRTRHLIESLYNGDVERTDMLERLIPGVPRWMISRWAAQLGIGAGAQRERRWTQQEMEFLHAHFARMPIDTIAKKLGRTVNAVKIRARRIHLYIKDKDGHTLTNLMLGLGVSDHHKVLKWQRQGLLKGKKLPLSDNAMSQPWRFLDKDVRDFIIRHPEEIDLRKVDKHWFIDLLAGGGASAGRQD